MSFYTDNKEKIDQSLHISYCAFLAFICLVGRLYWWVIPIAIVIPYVFACGREWYQHDRLVLWNKDVGFSTLGAVVGVMISFLIGV